MRVVLTPPARQELRHETEWYAERSTLVARRFTAEYQRIKKLVADNPDRWPEIEPGVRRILFDRFPFALLYAVESTRVIVLAIKHHKRRVGYWRDR
jgi:plasmid stabilization system protein ParE